MSNPGLDRFLAAVERLPAYEGLAFRGLGPGAAVPPLGVLTAVVSASSDPRVASENFACAEALVLLSRTLRDLSVMARHPEERELVVLPGSGWRKLAEVDLGDVRLHVLEELDVSGAQAPPPAAWGATIDDVVGTAVSRWRQRQAQDPVTVTVPGKFTGPWPVEEHQQP